MNAILLTKGWAGQARARPRRTIAAPLPSTPGGVSADAGPLQEASAGPGCLDNPGGSYREWAGSGALVETALFVSVQALMIACILVVAVQLFATA